LRKGSQGDGKHCLRHIANPDARPLKSPKVSVAWKLRGTPALINYLFRFTEKDPQTRCRVWLGGRDGNGYSCLSWYREDGSRTVAKVYRLVVEALSGPIPPGYHVHHRCANRQCINPDHLERSDARQNIGEMLVRVGYERYIEALRNVIRELSPGHPVLAETPRDHLVLGEEAKVNDVVSTVD